ncbi:hypothetical protein SCHPADRAFT_524712 [Schizopora paradoxa]|uniref:Uncharacterized protein n=1 Tax=Schizopora paradoxa TaxID=27342 RepID=A0A0H2REU1_9AGAM|nr:hypothetical protein SCHPADRAFT_524712 [Schizopora paradoxa]
MTSSKCLSPNPHPPSSTPSSGDDESDEYSEPKASGSKKRKASTKGKAKASGTKKPKTVREVKDPKPPATDPSTWRKSKIPPHAAITKGDAMAQYRLDRDKDFKDLKYWEEPTMGDYVAHMYWVRDIERAAWSKHGSPEGFDYYLSLLRERYNKRNAKSPQKKPFQEPSQYIDESVAIKDKYVRAFSDLQSRFPRRLWMNMDSHLEKGLAKDTDIVIYGLGHRYKEADDCLYKLRVALQQGFKDTYPRRPTNPAPQSESFTALKALLDSAPGHGGFDRNHPPAGIVSHEDHEGNESLDWDNAFKRRIDEAMDAVLAEHEEEENKLHAQWMVYDEYVQHLEGPVYMSKSNVRPEPFWIDLARKKVFDDGRLCEKPVAKRSASSKFGIVGRQ